MSGRNASGWTIHAIPILADNYAWALIDEHQAIIVDPGESAPIDAWLCERSLRLSAVLLTHHHHDHIDGAAALAGKWPDAQRFGPHDERIGGIGHRVGHGDRIEPAGDSLAFDIIAIPGHTSSHVAYHGQGLLFCGDTLFSVGCGRLFEGTAEQMVTSLDALAALPDDTLVCCGHEYTAANCAFALAVDPDNEALKRYQAKVAEMRRDDIPSLPSRLSDERAVNPFLRVDTPAIREALIRNRSLARMASRADAFAALRNWKDTYRG